jgi:hypothetical protein
VIIDLFAEWRVASRAASAAERAVSNAYRRFFQGLGELPTSGEIAEAKRKRDLADDLFVAAMRHFQSERKP